MPPRWPCSTTWRIRAGNDTLNWPHCMPTVFSEGRNIPIGRCRSLKCGEEKWSMKKFVVHELLRHTLVNRPDSEIVSGRVRLTYETMYERILRLADRLGRLGIGRGTVVGVMDVNSHRYLELHYALSMLGAVIHTLNFRLSGEDLAYTIRHAEDEWLFVWDGFAEAAEPLRRLVPNWVWLSDSVEGPEPQALTYEGLVEEGRATEPQSADAVDETTPYSLFYTTG